MEKRNLTSIFISRFRVLLRYLKAVAYQADPSTLSVCIYHFFPLRLRSSKWTS